jgi:hypothetical protein
MHIARKSGLMNKGRQIMAALEIDGSIADFYACGGLWMSDAPNGCVP